MTKNHCFPKVALLFLLAASCLQDSPAEDAPVLDSQATTRLLSRMAEARSSFGPRQMTYAETRTNPLLVRPVQQQGTIFFTPDNFFRKESESSALISDGKHLWIVYKDFAEVEKYSLEGSSPLARELRTLLSGFSPEKLQTAFHIQIRETDDGFFLQLRPRRRGQNLLREIRSHWTKELEIKTLEITGADDSRILLRFSNHAPLEVTPQTFAPPTEP